MVLWEILLFGNLLVFRFFGSAPNCRHEFYVLGNSIINHCGRDADCAFVFVYS